MAQIYLEHREEGNTFLWQLLSPPLHWAPCWPAGMRPRGGSGGRGACTVPGLRDLGPSPSQPRLGKVVVGPAADEDSPGEDSEALQNEQIILLQRERTVGPHTVPLHVLLKHKLIFFLKNEHLQETAKHKRARNCLEPSLGAVTHSLRVSLFIWAPSPFHFIVIHYLFLPRKVQ